MLDHLLHDIRHAVRQWLRAPGFVLTAVLTLALGIGGTTAMFTLVDALLLQPIPVSHPDLTFLLSLLKTHSYWSASVSLSASP